MSFDLEQCHYTTSSHGVDQMPRVAYMLKRSADVNLQKAAWVTRSKKRCY